MSDFLRQLYETDTPKTFSGFPEFKDNLWSHALRFNRPDLFATYMAGSEHVCDTIPPSKNSEKTAYDRRRYVLTAYSEVVDTLVSNIRYAYKRFAVAGTKAVEVAKDIQAAVKCSYALSLVPSLVGLALQSQRQGTRTLRQSYDEYVARLGRTPALDHVRYILDNDRVIKQLAEWCEADAQQQQQREQQRKQIGAML